MDDRLDFLLEYLQDFNRDRAKNKEELPPRNSTGYSIMRVARACMPLPQIFLQESGIYFADDFARSLLWCGKYVEDARVNLVNDKAVDCANFFLKRARYDVCCARELQVLSFFVDSLSVVDFRVKDVQTSWYALSEFPRSCQHVEPLLFDQFVVACSPDERKRLGSRVASIVRQVEPLNDILK